MFDEVKKIWSGSEAPVFPAYDYINFGDYLLEKLAGDDTERIMQVNIAKIVLTNLFSSFLTII